MEQIYLCEAKDCCNLAINNITMIFYGFKADKNVCKDHLEVCRKFCNQMAYECKIDKAHSHYEACCNMIPRSDFNE